MAIPVDVHDGASSSQRPHPGSSNNANLMSDFFRSLVAKWSDRITLDTLRPLPIFLGMTGPSFCFSPEAFTPPTKKLDKNACEKILSRMSLNFSFYLSNYALILFGVSVVVFLMNPVMIIYAGVLSGLWFSHSKMADDFSFTVRGRDLGESFPESRRRTILMTASVLFGLFYCVVPILCVFGIGGGMILLHSLMRDPKHIENSRLFRKASDSDDDDSGSEVLVDMP